MVVSRSGLAALLLCASFGQAAARPARCLVEADGKALISGPCDFNPLDEAGSFKVSIDGGAGAEVHITGKDATAALRPSPEGGAAPIAVDREGGCWVSLNDASRKVKVCAFAGAEFDVEPDPEVDERAIVYWGSRIGMFDEIASRRDLDSAHAMLRAVPSRAGAIMFCRQYAHDYTQACVAKALAARHPQTLTADCPRKRFTGFDGWRVAYVGLNHGDPSVMPLTKYLFRDLASGKSLDGSEASNYALAEGIYADLCPGSAPKPED